ncbi:hypothetical protein GC101_10500 [Paenibacillus sp. LMG 31459]|uniref:CBM-cenC domain-containing protein n=1 Tax=Paenibacillus phytohabitans TaxID=2654978 RepID=A0ABX1YGM8_9BACL|nr:carbohydrate binding domain-containing protein [Paenibacillus phytohabitans]NOU79311.1 hypothetical protein [Paenibacillus phytohabitans]
MLKKTAYLVICLLLFLSLVIPSIDAKSGTNYIYNKNGQLVELSNSNGNLEMKYDKNGNLIERSKSDNLLANSGFENYSGFENVADGWDRYMASGVKGTYEVITAGATEGKQAQKLTVSSFPNTGDGANVSQAIFVQGGQSYSVKGRLKLADMKNAKFEMIVFFYDANNQLIGGQTPVEYRHNTSDWVTFAGNVTAPAGVTSARVHMHLSSTASNGQGTFYLDGVNTTLQGDSNLVFNGGFESDKRSDGAADGWDRYMGSGVKGTYEVITAGATEGQQAQRLTVSSFPNTGDGANVSQAIFVQGGQSYSVKGKLKLADMKNAKFEMIVFFYDANNQLVGGQTPVQYTGNTIDWVTFAGNVTVPAGATSARVHMHLSATASNGQGAVYLDGVTATLQGDSNLVFNGSFESNKRKDGVSDGWDQYMAYGVKGAYEVITAGATEGQQVQKLTVSSFPNTGDGANVSQAIFVHEGQSYTVKGKLKLADMKNAKFEMIVFFYDMNNQLVSGQTPVDYTHNSADWVAFAGNVTAPTGAISARVHMHLSSTASNGQGTVYLDGVSIIGY